MSAQGLTIRAVGKAEPGGLTVILLHGFGAPGDDLVDLARYFGAPAGTRFLFPAAPLELPGLYGDSRAWWMIDLDRLQRLSPERRALEEPDGLVPARQLITALFEHVAAETTGPIALGGFSQGAMLSLDTALHLGEAARARLAGLLLMSGTPINGAAWTPRLQQPGPLTELPVLLSHGRQDDLLPFSAAERLRDTLRAAGAAVDWVEFDGGHEIPPPVLTAGGRVLAAAAARAQRSAP